jgi:hypothetical protein
MIVNSEEHHKMVEDLVGEWRKIGRKYYELLEEDNKNFTNVLMNALIIFNGSYLYEYAMTCNRTNLQVIAQFSSECERALNYFREKDNDRE